MSKLPNGWVLATINDLCSQPEQRVPPMDELFTYIDIAGIDRNLKIVSETRQILGANAPSRARKPVETGDVIVSMTRPNLNAVALVDERFNNCIVSTGFDVLKPIEVESRWIFSAVRTSHFIETMSGRVQGALYPAVSSTDIRNYLIPLPPLAEQVRITKKIDAQLALVQKLKDRIDTIPTLFKRFRQSVIAAAVCGRLTEEWRGAGGSAPLLQSPLVFSENNQSASPDSWRWSPLVSLAKLESGHTPRKSVPAYWEGGDVPWISLQDIRAADGKEIYQTKNMPTMTGIDKSSARLLPKGTVCFSRDISVGFVTMMGRPMATSQHFANWICTQELLPKYLMYSFMAARNHLLESGQGSTVKTIYMPALKQLKLLLPPIPEQIEIARRVEELFAFADQLEAKITSAKNRVDHLTQSILAKAFRGELVPQDPKDEPASVLLERIKAQRAAAPKAKRGRKASA